MLKGQVASEGRCQVVSPRAVLRHIELKRDVSSTAAGRLATLDKCSRSKDAMMDGSEVVTANTEQVLNRPMDGKE